MIKISHESPIGLLQDSLHFNDYQYCLVHLLEEQPKYLEHFERCRDEGIPVLLDNSIFELGTAFDSEEFAKWVDRLRPDEYIVPDVLEDSKGTIESLHNWVENFGHVKGKRIGVVQGKNYDEIVECYKAVDEHCDKIAISFNYSYYLELFPHQNKYLSWSMGRVLLLEKLLEDGIINTEKDHHLLGCGLPIEFVHYYGDRYSWIDSLDTSNPVVHGLLGIRYNGWGLGSKKSIMLCDMIDHEIVNIEDIKYNLKKFREFVNR